MIFRCDGHGKIPEDWVYSIINLNDRSSLIGTALTYSLASNLEIAASAYILLGAKDSEFRRPGKHFFGFLQ